MALPTVEAFERAGLQAWPGTDTHWDGQWLRRAAGGYTKRANCVQCLDPDDGEDADLRVISASTWMVIRGIKPVFRITPLSCPELGETLDEAGWQTIDQSHLYAMPLGEHQPHAAARLVPVLDDVFLAAQTHLQAYDPATAQQMRKLFAAIAVPSIGVVIEHDGKAVASALMAVADGIVVTGNVVTAPAQRRQGLARAVMETGLHWAAGAGATTAALNVVAENHAAKALYGALGYSHQYDYSYRIPGAR